MLRTLIILFVLALSGCSSVFFFPMEKQILTPNKLGLDYQNVTLAGDEQPAIHGWFMPAIGDVKGTVYFLHGNAENISTHLQSVYWLPEEGYQLFMIDYRGFGKSEGHANLPGAIEDIEAGFEWLLNKQPSHVPIFLLGQSLGASMGIYFAATHAKAAERLSGVISDAAFTGYGDIARHAASQTWVTWLLQYPASWLMIRGYDAVDYVGTLSPIPTLIIHSKDDRVIPFEQSNLLFAAAQEPKQRLITKGRHIGTFNSSQNRRALLEFLRKNAN
ncbi:MAG: alpha/beta hydrolase [Piscirickettsiaceae bacterium]|nr:MAG: alpha/beta hydrolase [Piscirickettsiaceae bacterium]